jgi:hypothetical protein
MGSAEIQPLQVSTKFRLGAEAGLEAAHGEGTSAGGVAIASEME